MRIAICRALSGKEVRDRTKTGRDRAVPVSAPLRGDLTAVHDLSDITADAYVFEKPGAEIEAARRLVWSTAIAATGRTISG